jgi:thiamine biosynthesis protein ThiS
MLVIINGRNREFPEFLDEAKLSEILVILGLKGDRVAIEHNGSIAPRPQWNIVSVLAGDRLEIVHFVGGG